MDIFGLGNILSALGLNKKVETTPQTRRVPEGKQKAAPPPESASDDTVTISDEAVVKSSIEEMTRQVMKDADEVTRADRIEQLRQRIEKGEYNIPTPQVVDRVINGVDIYEMLK